MKLECRLTAALGNSAAAGPHCGAPQRYTAQSTFTDPDGQPRAVNSNNATLRVDEVPGAVVVSNDAGDVGVLSPDDDRPLSYNGSPTSSLTYTFTSLASTADDVAFSTNGGASYTYTPVPNANGVDPNVTNLRINPKGTFSGDPTRGAPSPSCTASFRVRVE